MIAPLKFPYSIASSRYFLFRSGERASIGKLTPLESVSLRRDQKRFRQKIGPRVDSGLNDDPYDRWEEPYAYLPHTNSPCIFQDDPILIFDSSVKAKMNSGLLGDTDGRDKNYLFYPEDYLDICLGGREHNIRWEEQHEDSAKWWKNCKYLIIVGEPWLKVLYFSDIIQDWSVVPSWLCNWISYGIPLVTSHPLREPLINPEWYH